MQPLLSRRVFRGKMRKKKKKSEFPILSASVGPAEALNVFEDERRNVRMLRNAVCLFFFFFRANEHS